jgi:hypothetical protein
MTEPTTKPQTQDLPDHLKIEVTTDKVRTKGWIKFDKWVHFGIGLGLNIALALTQSIFQINWELNQKIDKAKEIKQKQDVFSTEEFEKHKKAYGLDAEGALDNYANASKRVEGGPLVYLFKFSKLVHKGTDWVFGVGRNEYGQAIDRKTKALISDTSDRPFYSGVASDVLALAIPGHVTTALIQIFENPKIKPHLVRWFDKKEDQKRIDRGEKITEEELVEREAIYKKLDTELAGKSMLQMWGARFMGIAVVIGSLIGLGVVDRKITGAKLSGEAGLFRVGQFFTQSGRFVDGGLESIKIKSPQWLKDATSRNPNTPNSAFSSRMLALVGTEVAGSTITSFTQYLTLMFKELFTSEYKDKKKEQKPASTPQTAKSANTEKTHPHAKSDNSEQAMPSASKEHPEKESVVSKIQPRSSKPEKVADYKEAVERSREDAAMHALAGAS